MRHVINRFLFLVSVLFLGANTLSASELDTTEFESKYMQGISQLYSSPETALKIGRTLLVDAKRIKDNKYEGNAYNLIALSYYVLGDLNNSLDYHAKALEIRKKIDDKKGISGSLNNIGNIYSQKGNYLLALDYYLGCLKHAEEIKDEILISRTLNNIGLIYDYQENSDEAVAYYTRSLKIGEKLNEKTIIVASLVNIGSIYQKQEDMHLALRYYEMAINNFQDGLNDKMLGGVYNNIGSVYEALNYKDSAFFYYEKSYNLRSQMGDISGMAASLFNFATYYESVNKQSNTIPTAEKALALALESESASLIRDISFLLYNKYKETGRMNSSFKMFEQYIFMRDSLAKEENQRELMKQQYKFEYEKRILDDSLKRAEDKRLEEVAFKKLEEEHLRRDSLQYSGILILFILMFGFTLGSSRFNMNTRITEVLIFLSFLLFFEFLLVLLDPFIDELSDGAPGVKLMLNATIAVIIFPLHRIFERFSKRKVLSNRRD
jgi:tetratricopeptide (TPR) repeat protein